MMIGHPVIASDAAGAALAAGAAEAAGAVVALELQAVTIKPVIATIVTTRPNPSLMTSPP